MTGQHSRARETVASAAQYVLLGGFASTAAGISAQGLVGFARSNMALRGPWPYLLFFALDGAAGVCAVLLVRRAARAEPGLAPRLAVWGLVASSSFFNWTHAPRRPAAPEAFGLMPVIAALLFEFCLREMRLRTANRADRTLGALRWLRPAERFRVQLCMAADQRVSAEEATSRVRIDAAARRLYHLRALLRARRAGSPPWHAHRAPYPAGRAPRLRRPDPRRVHRAADRLRGAPPGPGDDPDGNARPAGLRHRRRCPRGHRRPHLLHARRGTGTRSRAPGRAGRYRHRDRRGRPYAYSQPQRTPARTEARRPVPSRLPGQNRKRASRRTIRTPATVTRSSSQPPGASSPTPGTPARA